MRELTVGGILYAKGDQSDYYYFVLKGNLHLTVLEGAEMKFSKTVDESTFFGFRDAPGMTRNDFATAISKVTEVLQISTVKYKEIITQTQMSAAEKKIDFLVRYGPGFRSLGRQMIQEYEVFFVKEEYTKGYHVLKQGEQDDHIYIIYSGKCRKLLSTRTKPPTIFDQSVKLFPDDIQVEKPFMVLGQLRKGEIFGEISALNDLDNQFTVEVCSNSAIVYKIHRSNFIQHFGGQEG